MHNNDDTDDGVNAGDVDGIVGEDANDVAGFAADNAAVDCVVRRASS